MDAMRWSTQKAIYPPFVPLRSFKKANSLKADWEREREWEGGRDIDPPRLQLYIKWIKLIKVARTVCILSTSLKWEAWKTCIQYLMNFCKEMKGKGSVPFSAAVPQQTKWEVEVWIWPRAAEASFVDQHRRASHSQQSAAANRQLIPPQLPWRLPLPDTITDCAALRRD